MKDIKEITEQLEQGVKGVYNSEKYMNYLSFVARFHRYSINNSMLIWLQYPTASYVAGFRAWQKMNRQVRKGEKGIQILAPCPHKIVKEVLLEDGTVDEREITYTTFRPVSVFDISQTDGEEIPAICNQLSGEVENFSGLFEALKKVSPAPVEFEDIQTGANGYFNSEACIIRIKEGMSEMQTIKTLLHEIAHAILHGKDGDEEGAKRSKKEVQAESVAFTVCSMLGLDTSGYSFEYIADWSQGREAKELTDSMETIRKTANYIYDSLTAAA